MTGVAEGQRCERQNVRLVQLRHQIRNLLSELRGKIVLQDRGRRDRESV